MKPVGHIKFAALAALGLFAAASLHAQPYMRTTAGGPKSFNTSSYGYRDGQTFTNAQFNMPSGLAINTSGSLLFVADRTNNAIRQITLPAESAISQTTTFLIASNTAFVGTNRLNRPVDVVVDNANNVYILNRGFNNTNNVATNGFITKFDQYANFLGVVATNLTNVTAFTLDSSANIYVTFNYSNVLRVFSTATNVTLPVATNIIGTISNSNARLNGVAVLDSGLIALADANPTNSGIWLLNPVTGGLSILTGFNGTNEVFGTSAFATLYLPEKIAKAGGNYLVVADRGRHRIKVVDPSGTITNLVGVNTNCWTKITYSFGTVTGWLDGPGTTPSQDNGCEVDQFAHAEDHDPMGLVIAANGDVYDTEVAYHLIRHITSTGLTGPNGGSSTNSSTGTNSVPIIVNPPAFSPNTGYFPMGQTIIVTSSVPNIFYTTDGTIPTTNSPRAAVIGYAGASVIGSIVWNNPGHDLTFLNVMAVNGTNSSVVISGVPATTNSIGVPTGRSSQIFAGIGSTIIVPVVVNLRTNNTVKSFQFRVEVTPNGGAPQISTDFSALSITTNDFISVVTASQNGVDGTYTAQPYTSNSTQGLAISAIGNQANVNFQNYAVVAMLTLPIPATAQVGQTYTIQTVWASATPDAGQNQISLNTMPPTTILITNVFYTVGDVAPYGWYNAGDFGDGNLANNDVNTIFYASVGLRVPDAYSDAFDAMDAFPEDGPGFVGGDGQIRFLDWQIVSDRSLRLQTNNWARAWSPGGNLTNNAAVLVVPVLPPPPLPTPPGQVWYKQAAVGAVCGTNAIPGGIARVPVYCKTVNGANLRGLEFNATVTPGSGAPAIAQTVQFIPAAGVTNPIAQSFNPNIIGCGWPLQSVNIPSLSSNLLGYLQFTVPSTAQAGQTYTVTFTNADGSPDLHTQYDYFETRRCAVVVGNAPAPTPDGISDEWKIHFFGSVNSPLADANADPDGDGSPNWQEFLNGTDPTDASSKLKLAPGSLTLSGSQKQLPLRWLSAPGKVYAVERCTSLANGNWSAVSTVNGDGYQQQYTETNLNGGAVFYRVRVISAP